MLLYPSTPVLDTPNPWQDPNLPPYSPSPGSRSPDGSRQTPQKVLPTSDSRSLSSRSSFPSTWIHCVPRRCFRRRRASVTRWAVSRCHITSLGLMAVGDGAGRPPHLVCDAGRSAGQGPHQL